MFPIPQPEIRIDYLTLEKTSVTIPSLPDISRGWFCRITKGVKVEFYGVVNSVSQSESSTTILLSPMQSLFDVQIYKKKSTYRKSNIEGWIAAILTENFINSGDSVQNIFGLSISQLSCTNDVALNLEDDIFNFWTDVARKAIESAKIVIFCTFDPSERSVDATIVNMSGFSEITIEADLSNIQNQNFTLRDNYGNVNKCVIINSKNDSEKTTFYASDYSAPTVCRYERVTVGSDETFSDVARARADELLKNSDFNNLIELQYRVSDLIIPELRIGQPCRIIKQSTVYHTVLTGMTISNGLKTLIFGGVRVDLTKILKLRGVI